MDTIGYSSMGLRCLACCGALLLAGCGEQGPRQHHVAGQVTWRGQPVPAGMVTFTPDARQGNSGPQGFAPIRAGRYSTREDGRGPGSGPHLVAVIGYDGRQPTDESPMGRLLFEGHQFPYAIPEAASSLDIPVPD